MYECTFWLFKPLQITWRSFIFHFNLQRLCGWSRTKQLKCLCWVTAFTLKLTLPSGRFRWSHGYKHPAEPGLGQSRLLLVSGYPPSSSVTLGPGDLESKHVAARLLIVRERTTILFLLLEQTVLLKNWGLVPTFFAKYSDNMSSVLEICALGSGPSSKDAGSWKMRRGHDDFLHWRLSSPKSWADQFHHFLWGNLGVLTLLCEVFFFFYSISFLKCFYFWIYFYYVILAALGLCCCAQAFFSCGERGLLFVAVHGLLIAVASLVAERGL